MFHLQLLYLLFLHHELLHYLTMILFILIIILSIKCFNKEFVFEFNKNYLASVYSNIFNFKNIFNYNNDQFVDNEINYYKKDNKYISNSNIIKTIDSGVIKKCNNNEIYIFQNNNYIAIFIGYFDLYINNNDYVEKGSIIAMYFEPFSIYFIKDGEIFTYEEYIAYSF